MLGPDGAGRRVRKHFDSEFFLCLNQKVVHILIKNIYFGIRPSVTDWVLVPNTLPTIIGFLVMSIHFFPFEFDIPLGLLLHVPPFKKEDAPLT